MSVTSITETRQYLTFQLSGDTFALDVAHVREILEFKTVTNVPGMPEYMKGVINLRGSVVPVLDLGRKFGLGQTGETIDTCIVVVEVAIEGESSVIGALVDSVSEVLEFEPVQIEPPPTIGRHADADFIKGMGKKGNGFVIILDVDGLFREDELGFAKVNDADEAVAVNE
jgi:purine-binding chemotaxis protein CheW